MYVRHEQHPVEFPDTEQAWRFKAFIEDPDYRDYVECEQFTPLEVVQELLTEWAGKHRKTYETAILKFFAPAVWQKLLAMELQVRPDQTEIVKLFEKEEKLALLPFARLVIDRRNHRC